MRRRAANGGHGESYVMSLAKQLAGRGIRVERRQGKEAGWQEVLLAHLLRRQARKAIPRHARR